MREVNLLDFIDKETFHDSDEYLMAFIMFRKHAGLNTVFMYSPTMTELSGTIREDLISLVRNVDYVINKDKLYIVSDHIISANEELITKSAEFKDRIVKIKLGE
jgi:hypothetical protein